MTNRTPPELVQQIRKLRADGVTLREIVELTGVCATTAMKLTADMENVRRLAPRVSREQIERMQMLRREGLSRPEISAECGISLTTVRRHTAGIQPEGRKLLKEKIRQLYLEGRKKPEPDPGGLHRAPKTFHGGRLNDVKGQSPRK